eukprot:10755204-Heterocapsa_arctica.AAC.1
MARAVERKDWAAAETALLAANLGMAAYNQVCLQGGSDWSVAWLLTHLPEPSFSHISRVAPREQLRPPPPLADP